MGADKIMMAVWLGVWGVPMRRVHNRVSLKDFRRHLRHNCSYAENRLWRHLKKKQFLGLKFRRQHSIAQFVVDFYCPRIKLAIEIDGETHFGLESEESDKHRTEVLSGYGIRVVRILNVEVMDDIDGVLQKLQDFITTPTPPISLTRAGGAIKRQSAEPEQEGKLSATPSWRGNCEPLCRTGERGAIERHPGEAGAGG